MNHFQLHYVYGCYFLYSATGVISLYLDYQAAKIWRLYFIILVVFYLRMIFFSHGICWYRFVQLLTFSPTLFFNAQIRHFFFSVRFWQEKEIPAKLSSDSFFSLLSILLNLLLFSPSLTIFGGYFLFGL